MVYKNPGFTPEFRQEFAARWEKMDDKTFGAMTRLTRQVEYDLMMRDREIIAQMAIYGQFTTESADPLTIQSIPEQRAETETVSQG